MHDMGVKTSENDYRPVSFFRSPGSRDFIRIKINQYLARKEFMTMLMTILSIIVNIAYFAVLNMKIYTDRAMMPTGEVREWHRSPITRLNIAGQSFLIYLQIVLAAVSVITSVLFLFGIRTRTIRTIQLVSLIGSAVVFIIIMIVTSD